MECLGLSRTLVTLTGGAFDVALGSGLERLELIADELTVRSRAEGIRIDLGGIAGATPSTEWPSCSRSGRSGEPWSTVASARWWPRMRRKGARDGPSRSLRRHRRVAGAVPGQTHCAQRLRRSEGAHIVDPRSREPVEGRAAWVALDIGRLQPEDARRSVAALAEGLSTAFMVLSERQIAQLCSAVPGAEAWVLAEGPEAAILHHFTTDRTEPAAR